jgi:ComF family protein
MFRTLRDGLLDLLAPPECPGCALPWTGRASDPGVVFCGACAPLLEAVAAGMRPPAAAAAALAFQGPLADAIRRFKYGRASHLARDLSPLLVEAAISYAGLVDAVVPMPLHRRKLRERGFNPAALLAAPVADALSLPLRTRWLSRVRATREQAGLSSQQRQVNLAGAFEARAATGCRVLLIDDVWTTGATFRAAAAALAERGHRVTTLALAWAAP